MRLHCRIFSRARARRGRSSAPRATEGVYDDDQAAVGSGDVGLRTIVSRGWVRIEDDSAAQTS
jgi:hypothetical protein